MQRLPRSRFTLSAKKENCNLRTVNRIFIVQWMAGSDSLQVFFAHFNLLPKLAYFLLRLALTGTANFIAVVISVFELVKYTGLIRKGGDQPQNLFLLDGVEWDYTKARPLSFIGIVNMCWLNLSWFMSFYDMLRLRSDRPSYVIPILLSNLDRSETFPSPLRANLTECFISYIKLSIYY